LHVRRWLGGKHFGEQLARRWQVVAHVERARELELHALLVGVEVCNAFECEDGFGRPTAVHGCQAEQEVELGFSLVFIDVSLGIGIGLFVLPEPDELVELADDGISRVLRKGGFDGSQ
jgi:hypothetical protein